MITLLITFTIAESRQTGKFTKKATVEAATPNCNSVYSVEAGDSCFSVEQGFQLSTDFFTAINPNLNCDALFVGQWLCVDGTLT
ncbi:hypothetical protein CsatB_012058 [Cannabis sativa]